MFSGKKAIQNEKTTFSKINISLFAISYRRMPIKAMSYERSMCESCREWHILVSMQSAIPWQWLHLY